MGSESELTLGLVVHHLFSAVPVHSDDELVERNILESREEEHLPGDRLQLRPVVTRVLVQGHLMCLVEQSAESSLVDMESPLLSASATHVKLGVLRERLRNEDALQRPYRRAIAFHRVLHTDVVPAITNDHTDDQERRDAIGLLMELTTPVDSLFSASQLSTEANEADVQMVYEIKQLLQQVKKAFVSPAVADCIVERIRADLSTITAKKGIDSNACVEVECTGIITCLKLLRNVLGIPDDPNKDNNVNEVKCSNHNRVLWNLFSSNLDVVIVELTESTCLQQWAMPLMQLIAIVYKDQHVHKLQRLIQEWLDKEISESSDGFESNTSSINPPPNDNSSSPMITSGDDSSNSSTNVCQKIENMVMDTNASAKLSSDMEMTTNSNAMEVEEGSDNSSTKEPPCKRSNNSNEAFRAPPNPELMTVLGNSFRSSFEEDSTDPKNVNNNTIGGMKQTLKHSASKPGSKTTAVGCGTKRLRTVRDRDIAQRRRKGDHCVVPKETTTLKRRHPTKDTKRAKSSSGVSSGLSNDSNKSPVIQPEQKADKTCQASFVGAACSSTSALTSSLLSSEASSTEQLQKLIPKRINVKIVDESNKKRTKASSSSPSTSSWECHDKGSKGTNVTEDMLVENNSTSSNEDDSEVKKSIPKHINLQRPRAKKVKLSLSEWAELRRKKLLQKSKAERKKIQSMVNYQPTDEDISVLLQEFTVDFTLKGYASLVDNLRLHLLNDDSNSSDCDESHFLWLIAYFIKFTSQLELDNPQVGRLLSLPNLSFLTYEGVRFFEDLEVASRNKLTNLKPYLRRLHLVITAIQQFIETLASYCKADSFAKEAKDELVRVQTMSARMSEVRQLFLLLLRRFNPRVQSLQYLKDVILGNHSLLLTIEQVNSDPKVLTQHLLQFATRDVMRQYGIALKSYKLNSEDLNDAIFTMMHHVSGDLNRRESLFVPQILMTLCDIMEQEPLHMSDEWTDLMSFIVNCFVKVMGLKGKSEIRSLVLDHSNALHAHLLSADENSFTEDQLNSLPLFFSKSKSLDDSVGTVIDLYKKVFRVTKTRLAVIQALFSQGIITHAQYMGFIYMTSKIPFKPRLEGSVIAEAGSERDDSDGHETDHERSHCSYLDSSPATPNRPFEDQIKLILDILRKQSKAHLIRWLQKVLLDTCMVKLCDNNAEGVTPDGDVLEPVPFHYNYKNQSIPIVSWNKEQECGLQTESFILLLHKMGFHLAADVGKLFPRIPHFWSPDHLLHLAMQLGPVPKEDLTFELSMLMAKNEDDDEEQTTSIKHPIMPRRPLRLSLPVPSPSCSSEDEMRQDKINSDDDSSRPIEPNFGDFVRPMALRSWKQLASTSKQMSAINVETINCNSSSATSLTSMQVSNENLNDDQVSSVTSANSDSENLFSDSDV